MYSFLDFAMTQIAIRQNFHPFTLGEHAQKRLTFTLFSTLSGVIYVKYVS